MSTLTQALNRAVSSKIVWFNIVYTVGELAVVYKEILPAEYIPALTILQSTVTVILRVWFNKPPN